MAYGETVAPRRVAAIGEAVQRQPIGALPPSSIVAGTAGAGGKVTATFTGSALSTITGAVTAGSDGEGVILINNSASLAADVVFAGNVGTSTAAVNALAVSDGNVKFDGWDL